MTLESLGPHYAGRRVLVTGHTGFKGSWLVTWLEMLGAKVFGFAQPPMPGALPVTAGIAPPREQFGDIRSLEAVEAAVNAAQPEVVFHLAAQALVRRSYEAPLETFEVNATGTANVLEAIRRAHARCAVVVVSSDKCYENREWVHGYREDDALGGHDVYSMSKAATELVASSWRRSFFAPARLAEHGVAIASARAGNVIGGGDWAVDRLVPDIVRSVMQRRPVQLRNPNAVRPWQHVLEPLAGYLQLGARLLQPDAALVCEAFNFGPNFDASLTVREVAELVVAAWGAGRIEASAEATAHEAQLLRLSSDKARAVLGWAPRWNARRAVEVTLQWYRAQSGGARPADLRKLCERQIEAYTGQAALRLAA